MGFLDTITAVTNTLGKERGANQDLLNGVLGLFKGNGLKDLLDAFSRNGLEDVVRSWIATGANREISVGDVERALGPEKLAQMAQQAGVPVDNVSSLISKMLPDIVDKVTPKGTLDQD
ncbi:MAG TPA: YidB family protein [Spirochaetota bacterium]|nr:YidB family protein [Spirochaetota bacterium]HNT10971.1 YidB family protein [Spirochaetota bacterium]